MPPGKRRQSNAMLYTLVTFVALFVVATTVAVIYYVKAEDLRTKRADAEQKLKEIASVDEVRRIGEIVGEKAAGQSYLGTTMEYMDQIVGMVTGKPVQATTAQVKAGNASRAIRPLLARAQPYIGAPAAKSAADANTTDPNATAPAAPEPNQVALTTVMASLLDTLKQTTREKDSVQQSLKDTQEQFKVATDEWAKAKEDLKADVEKYRQDVEKAKADYAALRDQNNLKSKEQMDNLDKTLKDEQAQTQQLKSDLAKAQDELKVAQERLKDALEQVTKVQPAPERQVAAQTPDGKIILVDAAAGTVYINLGSDDKVYPGLTFSIYDQSAGIPLEGTPKAEVEVFAIDRKVCTARILPPIDYDIALAAVYKEFSGSTDISKIMFAAEAPFEERTQSFRELAADSPKKLAVLNNFAVARLQRKNKKPIGVNDFVANLIWERGKQNQFVIVGDFDLSNDGKLDYNAVDRIGELIRKWGGAVSNDVSAKTDFVILGTRPVVPPEPTVAAQANDPGLKEKYDAASQRLDRYNQILQQAQSLHIPILNYERFLYFIGYQSSAGKPGAF